MKHVVFLLYDGVQLLDIAGPAEVLSVANALSQADQYQLHYLSTDEQSAVRTSIGTRLECQPFSQWTAQAVDMVIVPGGHHSVVMQRLEDPAFISRIRHVCDRATIKASVCMGSFFLGEIGYLNHRKVTTHWDGLQQLQQRYPQACVQENILYVNEGDIWTSAGIMSGVDMMLAFLAQDCNKTLALAVARILVVYLFRDGGQAQFSAPINYQSRATDSSLMALISWLEQHLHQPLSVDDMATATLTSVRNLHRKCQQTFDMSPAQLLQELRLERARRMLEEADTSIKSIASACGFQQANSFSRAFNKRYGVSPSDFRQRFFGE